jgi:hypothetical protein
MGIFFHPHPFLEPQTVRFPSARRPSHSFLILPLQPSAPSSLLSPLSPPLLLLLSSVTLSFHHPSLTLLHTHSPSSLPSILSSSCNCASTPFYARVRGRHRPLEKLAVGLTTPPPALAATNTPFLNHSSPHELRVEDCRRPVELFPRVHCLDALLTTPWLPKSTSNAVHLIHWFKRARPTDSFSSKQSRKVSHGIRSYPRVFRTPSSETRTLST